MWRLITYPCYAVEWAWKVLNGYCRPYCTDYGPPVPNPDGKLFPIVVRCRRCGRKVEV